MSEDDQSLCEQLLLLLLNSDGKPVAGRTTGYLLAGALLADLALRGRVDIAGRQSWLGPVGCWSAAPCRPAMPWSTRPCIGFGPTRAPSPAR